MGRVANIAAAVVDLKIWVMVFAMRDPGERIHERHRFVEILELKMPRNTLAIGGKLPTWNIGEQLLNRIGRERRHSTFAR